MSKLLLAVDQGTSGCKITFFDLDGNVVASENGSYKTYYPAQGHVEQDPREWWNVICTYIQKLVKECSINPKEVVGIGVDGTSWACLPVNYHGNVLDNAMIWLDRRADKQVEWMKKKVGEERLITISGNPVDAAYITPKILWLKENKPEVYQETHKFLQSNAYIVYNFTGEYSQDYSQGYGFHFFNMRKGAWDENIAEKLGISLDLMAPLTNCHQVVGTVTQEAAKQTGLVPGIPVVAGGLDAACCTLGAGVINIGQTQEQGGQAGGMSIVIDKPLVHPKLILGYHVLPNKWLLQGGTTGGGGTLNWFNRELGSYEKQLANNENRSSFSIMSEEASKISAGSEDLIFLPYMSGERSPIWNSKARGVYFGLAFDKTRAHMIRSMMEGVAYSLQHNIKTAEEVGAYIDTMTSVGGSANSKVWSQIKADVTGKKIEVPYSDYATTLGAAILAGVGAGVYSSFEEAIDRTVKVQRTHEPNIFNESIYKQGYKKYLKLSKVMIEAFWS